MRRRPVMLTAAAVSFLLFSVVPVAEWTGHLNVGLLVVIALLTGTAAVFFQTAYTAYLPSILTPADQLEGNAKLHGSASAAQIAGLGSAGLIGQTVGAVSAMFANAATFLFSLLCVASIRKREPRRERRAVRSKALLDEVGEGLRLVARDPWLRTLTLFGAASNLALMGYQSIQVVFLVHAVGLAPGAVGGLIAAASAGGVARAFVARRVADRIGTARAMLLFELGFAIFSLLIPAASAGAGLLLFATG
nr:MFS transporter [Microbispora catharanthi]